MEFLFLSSSFLNSLKAMNHELSLPVCLCVCCICVCVHICEFAWVCVHGVWLQVVMKGRGGCVMSNSSYCTVHTAWARVSSAPSLSSQGKLHVQSRNVSKIRMVNKGVCAHNCASVFHLQSIPNK